MRSEPVGVLERGEIGKELQLAPSMHGLEALQEQAPEQAREHANRKKEAGLAGNPMLAIRRYATGRHDTVHVRMMLEILGGERLGCRCEQQPINLGLVLVGDRADCGW